MKQTEEVGGKPANDLNVMAMAASALYTRTTSSGGLVQTKDDKDRKALHLVSPRPGGGFDYYRYDSPEDKWSGPFASAGSAGNVHGPIVFSGRTEKDRLDAIFREVSENREVPASEANRGRLIHTYSSSSYRQPGSFPWGGPRTELPEAKDVIGTPAVCPWNDRDQGLDVIAPIAGGGLRHWWRYGDGAWGRTPEVVHPGRSFKSCAIIKGWEKHLHVIALDDADCLWHIERGLDNRWNEGTNLGSGFTGTPAFVETGLSPAYHLVVPLAKGGIGHYAFGDFKLPPAAKFGGGNTYREIGLVYDDSGLQLEVVARTAYDTLEHYRFNFKEKIWVGKTPLRVPLDPVKNGSWKVEFDTKAIGVHASVLHTEEVLLFGVADDSENESCGALLDTAKKTVNPLPAPVPHVFCSGHAFLGNGDLLVAGGHTGHEDMLNVFARNGATWEFRKQTKLTGGRWYPTCTTLPSGKVLILSGLNMGVGINNSYELYDPQTPDSRRRYDLKAEVEGKFCDDSDTIDMYPFVYVLPNQKLFVHSRYTTRFFELPGTGKGSWREPINAQVKMSRTYPWEGTSVLLPLKPGDQRDYRGARVALFGGATKGATIDTPACNSVELMVTDAASPQWELSKQSLCQGRAMADSVLLPDGKVLIVSGSRSGLAGKSAREPELSAELFDPDQQTFTSLAPMRTPRLYHATAVLLPDATVLVTGKCKVFNPPPYDYAEHRGEVFTPPYLQTKKPRPVIATAPSTIDSAGATIEIGVNGVSAAEIESAILIRPSSATHSINMDQRAVVLTPPKVTKPGAIEVLAPKSNWVVPPGYYMLFLVSKDGVPSVAEFVQVKVFPG